MNRKTLKILTAVLVSGMLLSSGVRAQEPPKMPYVFEMNCFLCHKSPERTGPISIYDMKSKNGNPLHEQYIRNNARFGLNAMPAFRISEVTPKGLNAIVAYLKEVAEYRKIHPEYKPVPAKEGGAKK
jgi:mono/diheme cytochrome c family protein